MSDGSTLRLDTPQGTFTLDVAESVLIAPDGLRFPLEPAELVDMQSDFEGIATLGPAVAGILAGGRPSPPPPEPPPCIDMRGSSCDPLITGGPGGGTALAARRPYQPFNPFGLDTSLAVRRASPELGAVLQTSFDYSCQDIWDTVQALRPTYERATAEYKMGLAAAWGFVGGPASWPTLKAVKDAFGKPISVPWSEVMRQLRAIEPTWIELGVGPVLVGGTQALTAVYGRGRVQMAFLVTQFNMRECGTYWAVPGTAVTTPNPAGGGEPYVRTFTWGTMRLICRFTDYYDPGTGSYLTTAKEGCRMELVI